MHGKIIDFEGIDGTGKSTQVELLKEYLAKIEKSFSFYKFPQYQKTIFGKMVEDFLKGDFGKIEEISPYFASLPYAFDRSTVAEDIINKKKKGEIVVFDRYVPSTMAHQSSRIKPPKKKKFLNWLNELEYKTNNSPKEDVVLLLDMPVDISLELIKDRKKDLLEQRDLQEETRKTYLKLAKANKHWLVINCIDSHKKLRSKAEIHQEIVQKLKSEKII